MTTPITRLPAPARKYLARVFYKYFYLREDPVSRIINHLVPPPQSPDKAIWDLEYSRGIWNKLLDLSEQGHYAIVRSYVLHVAGEGEILDVGCGEGLVLEQLAGRYRRYIGIDISEFAQAGRRHSDAGNSAFIVANAEEYVPQGSFDVIVFCESIYYFEQPVKTVLRYRNYLKQNGAFVISLHAHVRTEAIRACLKKQLHLVHETLISNDRSSWFCMLMRPVREASSAGSHLR